MSDDIRDLERWDRKIVWHAFTQMAEYEPWIIESADGCVLRDQTGAEFLDGVSSIWCNVHGHRHPKIDQAIREQLDKVAHVTLLGQSNPTTIRLAKRLVDITPNGLNHVFFASDGACAVEVALKIAFQYWRQRPEPGLEKSKYIAFDNAYHGDTLGSASVGGITRFRDMFAPLLFDVIQLPIPCQYRRPPGVDRDQACSHYLNQLRQVLKENHTEVAALVIEPLMQAAAGMITHPPGFLRGVRELTREFNVLMIADEVAVGFGRTGTMFACQQEEVAPDLLCLGKGLSGGYLPVAATMTTSEIWKSFLGDSRDSRTLFHGHTFGGNPLGAAAALASLEVFDSEQTLTHLPAKIDFLANQLAKMSTHAHVGDIRQCGLIGAVELVADRRTGSPFPRHERRGWRVCQVARERGVWLRPLGDIVVIMPPLSISHEQLDQICGAVNAGIEAATATEISTGL